MHSESGVSALRWSVHWRMRGRYLAAEFVKIVARLGRVERGSRWKDEMRHCHKQSNTGERPGLQATLYFTRTPLWGVATCFRAVQAFFQAPQSLD